MFKSSSPSQAPIAEIITIGDELNRGEVVDTNAAWLAEQLTLMGFSVRHRHGVCDRISEIAAALETARDRAQVVIVCGGLGPTSDDLTVDAVAALLDVPVVSEPAHERRLRERFAERAIPLTPNNLRQVRLPEGAKALENRTGLAPGFVVDIGPARCYFLPGVPREMKPMFETEVAQRLRPLVLSGPNAARRTYRVIGLGESHVDHLLSDLVDGGTSGSGAEAVTIHYRLAFPEVLVTLVAHGESEAEALSILDRLDPQVRVRLGGALYSEGQDDLPVVVGRLLAERGETVATAESCTGGMIGELLTSVPGSSAYYLGGVISYANEVKVGLLGVPEEVLSAHGAVSAPCVAEMCQGVRRLTGATYGVAASGIAGPEGGTVEKPVGTVHVGVAGPGGTETRKVFWPGDREQIRRIAACAALNVLHKILVPSRRSAGSSIRERLG